MQLTMPANSRSESAQRYSQQRPSAHSLVVIDAAVPHLSTLLTDLDSQVNILLLTPEQDGVFAITKAIAAAPQLSSLHIVSHGTPGHLHLGGAQLSLETMGQYAASLQTWAEALQGQDILLYGCQVARGAMGHLFLQQLQQLTGANIAASERRVGRVGRHTHWTLDTQLGEVQTPLIFSEALQASYPGHFEPVVNFSLSTDTLIESEGTPFSFIFELSEPPPAGGTTVRFEADRPQAINQWDLFALTTTGIAGIPVDVSPNEDFSAFEVTIVEQRATIDLPVFNDFIDDSPDPYTWTISPVSGGTVGTSSASVTIYDDPSEVPVTPPAVPEVSITSDVTTLVEDEGTEVTLTITLSEPPEGAVLIDIGTGKPFALGDFDIFPPPPQAVATGGQLVAGNADNSGFRFAVTAQTATVKLPIFDDPDRTEDGTATDPDGPLRNDDIGEEQTTFTVSPGDGYTVSSTAGSVTLTLKDTNVVNSPPEADDDSYSTEFDTPLTVDAAAGVLDGDTDADGDDLSATIASDPSNGTVSLDANGAFTYTPNAGFSGDDSFTYSVDDGNGGTDTATVTVSVAEPIVTNSPPVADDDSYSTEFGTELTVGAADGVLDGDTDADGDPLSAAIATDPGNGTAALNSDGSFTYTPNAGFSGDDSFTYTVSDGNGGTDTATVTVTVEAEITPDPLVVGLSAAPTALVEEDGTVTTLTFSLSAAPPEGGIAVTIDSDIPASLAEFDVNAASFNGLQLVSANADSSGFTVNITEQTATIELPVFDDDLDEGLEEITYALQAGDGYEIDGAAGSTTLSITDNDEIDLPENTPPVADDDSYSTLQDTPLTIAAAEGVLVGDTDADSDSLVATFVSNPSNGSVELAEDGSFTYTPNAGFTGADSFTYQASDGQDSSNVATVTVEVSEDTPDTPVVSFSTTPGVISEAEGTALVMNFAVAGDIPAEGITVSLEGDAARIMQQFTAAQTRFDSETGEIFYRFDRGLVEDNVTGGVLDLFALEDGNPAEGIADPAAAGDAFLSDFTFTITEANASITIPVFDDIVEEDDTAYTYTLVGGEGYSVDPSANTGTFTVTDGVLGGVGPTIGVTVTPETLTEAEQTAIALTFNTVGDIPAEGVVVQLAGPARAIAEFDVNATNPRLPEDETVVEGVVVEGGSIVGTDNVAGSVFFRITDPTATITVPVFQDDVAEGTEDFTFSLLDGELYEVDANASEILFSIEDGVPAIPGTEGDDTLLGTDGDDTIRALAGNDTVAGGLGNDIIEGGDGNDVLRGDANSRDPQDGLPGGNDIIFGGAGNDRIGGKAGNDILSGDAGDDFIWGDSGDDIIMGGTGNDILVGDNFSGGSGSDLFVFGNGDGTDTILDFEVGTDRIGLVDGELTFEDLTITQDGNNTLLGVTSSGETLAVLNNVQASALGADSFAVVPDVSNPEEALQLI